MLDRQSSPFCFILLLIGTAGLLINEFVVHLGTATTLIFALFNVIGLILLGSWLFRKK